MGGGIREDYVVGFAGPRPQEVDCGPWLIALYYQQSPIIFEMSAPITARRMRAFGYAIPRLFIARATRKPPFSTRHSSSTSTVTSAPMRSASNSAQDRCAALCLRVSSSFLPAVVSREGKQQHTTYSRYYTPSDVTVTRRHHPLLGQRLEVAIGGASAIVVRMSDGTTMRIPRTWTDADGAPPHEPAETVFSIEALRDLLRLLDSIGARA
jgi:Family of unknown function (DUF5372)